MKNFYRYKAEPFHWLFTNKLKSAATVLYDLTYSAETRSFLASMSTRSDEWQAWGNMHPIVDERVEQLRALLPPSEIAACVAASMVEVGDADA